MRKLTLSAAVVATGLLAAVAADAARLLTPTPDEFKLSGSTLHEWCSGDLAGALRCEAYMLGVFEAWHAAASFVNEMVPRCPSVPREVQTRCEKSPSASQRRILRAAFKFCVPAPPGQADPRRPGKTLLLRGDATELVTSYLRDNPEERRWEAHRLVIRALQEAWPCDG